MTHDNARLKVVLIGAGSTVFTPGLLADLVASPVFDQAAIHLVDINADAASTMAALGRRIAKERGSGLTVEAHVDRREALPGAALVATTIAVGGAAGWRVDLDVPDRHGVRQTVGDSVGPGGVLRALRQVPELVAIGRDVAELAPKAWLANYANPLTANVRAIGGWAHPRTFGLCHGTMHTRGMLAGELGIPRGELTAVFAGLNHLCWLTELRHGREDVYPRLRQLVAEATKASGATGGPLGEPVTADLMDVFGLYPAPGDRHVAEFFNWYLGGPASGGDAASRGEGAGGGDLPWGLQPGLDATRHYIDEKSDLWDRLHAQASGAEPLDEAPGGQEAERLVSIAEALCTGREIVELAVNVPNRGKIPNLPPEAVVEVPAVIGAAGVTGLAVGDLPPAIASVLTARALQQELTVQAALNGSRQLALQALATDPLVPNPQVAAAMLNDAIVAHRPLLDAFA
jgi:alpha-galactosidase/6-phospho-beta-glucosidase family protein